LGRAVSRFGIRFGIRIGSLSRFKAQLSPYLATVKGPAAISDGAEVDEASAPMTTLALCRRCFMLDHTGRMVGQEFVGQEFVWQAGPGSDFRLRPLLLTQSLVHPPRR
jgi:hypothetical protein